MQERTAGPIRLRVKSKRLPAAVSGWLGRQFDRMLGFARFNAIYADFAPCAASEASRNFLDRLNIRVDMDGEPLSSVPKKGPLLFVANHPHGLVDGFALDAQLTPTRPDGWLMGFYVLGEVPEFRERLITVDPERKRSKRRRNLRGWREAYRLLERGGALVVFPAGAVSRFDRRKRRPRDPEWSPHIAALARRTGAAVMPFHIHGRNSWPYLFLGAVSPKLQNLLVFSEMHRTRGRVLRITAGPVITAAELAALPSNEAAITYLRDRTDALAGR